VGEGEEKVMFELKEPEWLVSRLSFTYSHISVYLQLSIQSVIVSANHDEMATLFQGHMPYQCTLHRSNLRYSKAVDTSYNA
jgi:hypothetical protein